MDKIAIFTMDVESIYNAQCLQRFNIKHTIDTNIGINNYLKILDNYNIKGDFFVVSSIVDETKDTLIKALNNGHKINSHGLNHQAPMTKTNKQFESDLLQSKKELESKLQTKIYGYRAPCFSIDDEKFDIIKNNGFKYDSSFLNCTLKYHIGNISFDNYKCIDKNIYYNNDFYEFCMPNYHKFPVGGGAFARISNWPFFKFQFNKYIKRNNIYIFYLHPFELTDDKLPKEIFKQLKFYDKFYFKHSRGQKFAKKINWIIKKLKKNGFEFKTFEEIIKTN